MARQPKLINLADPEKARARAIRLGGGHWSGWEEVAIKNAEKLLVSSLTDAQKREWKNMREITVTTPIGHEYIIMPTYTYNLLAVVHVESFGKVHAAALCVQFEEYEWDMPIYDGVYMLKTLLEASGGEELVLAKANWFESDSMYPEIAQAARPFIDYLEKYAGTDV